MAPREPTRLEQLRDTGRYIDQSLQPTSNEVPGIIAALIYGDDLVGKVGELRQEGLTDSQISHEISHVIAPPDPDAGANIVQGVPPEAHQALLDEVAQLRESVRSLTEGAAPQQIAPGQTTANAPPVAAADQLTAEQQELASLREQVQQLRVQEAAGQHPTATSEPVPDDQPPAES